MFVLGIYPRAVLENLTPDATYFYRISSSDRDGNRQTSPEATFSTDRNTLSNQIYLPFVRR